MSLLPYWMRAVMSHTSPPTLVALLMVYLSSFSGPSLPSLIPHQRPLMVAFVRVVLNFASSSSWVGLGFSVLGAGVESGFSAVPVLFSCAGAWLAQASPRAVTRGRRIDFMRAARWKEHYHRVMRNAVEYFAT